MSTYGPACNTPIPRAALRNWWEGVTFLHWRYEPDLVQRPLPPGLEVETFEGAAWVGLVLLRMGVGLLGLPPVPWLLRFPETNVRTYVRNTPALHHARAFHEPWPMQRARIVRL